ncbi:MAG: DNA mismatch repair endonuclease MutL [Clostridiales bacterium]|nr:DNA mismatch repair endonuclease MutL [Clostridiales bacterium]
MGLKEIFERKRIQRLPKSVADRIAAGEVVDRPISIVKELVENSIDSGADSITVEIKNGGKSYIRVTDNGCGIPPQDVETAFFRHATSKIEKDSDLFKISTLGFRGEALASIAAVTRTQMITKIPEESAGVKISIDGGNVVEKVPVGASDGTTIVVKDLFYNTPAREKFMKKDGTESSLITDFISKMALAYPDIKFRMINNGSQVFGTSGKGDVLENIYVIYGKEIGSSLISFEKESGDMKVKGFISNPKYTKNTRRNQFYFVNGRYIVNKTMEDGVALGYGDKIPEGRYPVAYIFLELPPGSVDVNVHPNKKEIRFSAPLEVREFIRGAVFERLNTRSGITDMSEETILKGNSMFVSVTNTEIEKRKIFAVPDLEKETFVQEEIKVFKPKAEKKEEKFTPKSGKVDIINLQETKNENIIKNREDKIQIFKKAESEKVEEISAIPISEPVNEVQRTDNITETVTVTEKEDVLPVKDKEKKFDVSELEVMGVLFNTYIAAKDYNTFYLIDQHAAHERVFYEKFLNEFYSENASPQMILAPIVKEIPHYVKNADDGWAGFLEKAGFIPEPFGERTYIFRGIPSYMDMSEAERFLDDYLDGLSEISDFKDRKTVEKIIMRSCKSAVKANDRLTADEIRALLNDLSETENPFSCPHGRPVIIKMGVKDMEKMFKRI